MNHRLARKLMYVFLVVGIVLTYMLAFLFPERLELMAGIGCAITLLGIMISRFFIRCPHCHAPLNMRGLSPDYCPWCGKEI